MGAEWSFLTNHARVLVCIAHDPGLRLRDIAEALGITERTAFGIVTDLTEAGYVVKEKDGRRNRYQIQPHLPLRQPVGRERRSARCSTCSWPRTDAHNRGGWQIAKPDLANLTPTVSRANTARRPRRCGLARGRTDWVLVVTSPLQWAGSPDNQPCDLHIWQERAFGTRLEASTARHCDHAQLPQVRDQPDLLVMHARWSIVLVINGPPCWLAASLGTPGSSM